MTKVQQIADFSGQTINVGQYLRKFQQEAKPETLIRHLTNHFPNAHFKLAYEAGFCGFWIQREFEQAGMECIVVNAADVPQTDKGIKSKTDAVDSRRIGQALSAGMLRAIYVPTEETESDRSLVRYRHRLRADLARSKSRIKSFLHHMGIKIPAEYDNSRYTLAFLKWLKELPPGAFIF